MMIIILPLIIIITGVIVYGIGNAFLYLAPFFLCRAILRKIFPKRSAWQYHLLLPALMVIGAAILVPTTYNVLIHWERASLNRDDKSFTGPISNIHSMALLLSQAVSSQNYHSGWPDIDSCPLQLCQYPLIDHVTESVLIGWQDKYRPKFDASEKVTRFRLLHNPKCDALIAPLRSTAHITDMVVRLGPDLGGCLVHEEASLGEADVAVLGSIIPNTQKNASWGPGLLSFYKERGIVGSQLSLYQHQGDHWQMLARETHIGGADLFVPLLIGIKYGGFPFGGVHIGFVRAHENPPQPFNIKYKFLKWGLSTRITEKSMDAGLNSRPSDKQ